MSSYPPGPVAPFRIVQQLTGPARLMPALASLSIDTGGRWVELDLLPVDRIAVCIAPRRGIELRQGYTATERLWAVVPLRRACLPLKVNGQGPLLVALLTPLGAIRAFGDALGAHGRRTFLKLPSATSLHRQLLRQPDPAAQLGAFHAWMQARMDTPVDIPMDAPVRRPGGAPAGLRTAETAMRLVEHGHPGPLPTLGQLALHAGVTPRHLRRDFLTWLGVGPSDWRRLVRLQRSLAHIATGQALAEVAEAEGYADQAHMTREIREWTGLGPQRVTELHAAPAWAALRHALDARVALWLRAWGSAASC